MSFSFRSEEDSFEPGRRLHGADYRIAHVVVFGSEKLRKGLAEVFGIILSDDDTVDRNRDGRRFFGYDDRDGVRLFADSNRSAVPRSKVGIDIFIASQRQKATGSCNATLLNDDGPIMNRSRGMKDCEKKSRAPSVRALGSHCSCWISTTSKKLMMVGDMR